MKPGRYDYLCFKIVFTLHHMDFLKITLLDSKQECLRHLNIEKMSRQVFYWQKEKRFIQCKVKFHRYTLQF